MSTDPVTEVVLARRALAAAGLSDLVWGHVGVRDPDGWGVWMKAAGWGFEALDASRVVLVSDAAECARKRTECWNSRQLHAGLRYLPRTAGVDAPDELEEAT